MSTGIADIHQDLIELSKAGDSVAQKRLYQKYEKAMFNTCMRMLRNWEDAEDALQDAFVYAFTKIESYRGDATFGAWLKRIVVNHCINQLKSRSIRWTDIDEEEYHLAALEIDEPLSSELEIHVVRKCIELLPEGYRTVFNLYLVEGYDHQEIAEILGISESTSKSQYLRAKRKLKELISSHK